MALAKLATFITSVIYIQAIHGQQNALINGAPVGQSGLNQGFQNTAGTIPTPEGCIQNGSAGNLASNLNTQVKVNFQPLIPQSTTMSTALPSLSLQPPSSNAQPINLQLSQIPNFQQTSIGHPSLQLPDTSFLQQTLLPQSTVIQQPQNLQQPQNVFQIPLNIQQVPCIKHINSQQPISLGDFNVQQQLPISSSVVQQGPVQPQVISVPSAAFMTPYPSVSTVPNYPYQRTDFMNNLGNNYLSPTANVPYPILETPQIATPYSTMPIMTILGTPNAMSLVTNSIIPYGNPPSDIIESPLRISNNPSVDDETNTLYQDNFTSFLLSLLQSSKKSPKHATSSGYPANPFAPTYSNQVSKSSSIKAMLPLILSLLNERKDECGCREACQNCDRKRKFKKDTEPKIYGGYSKKRDYSLREEKLASDETEEEIPRIVRDHKKQKTIKNSIPIDSCEYDDEDSDEQVD